MLKVPIAPQPGKGCEIDFKCAESGINNRFYPASTALFAFNFGIWELQVATAGIRLETNLPPRLNRFKSF